MSEKDEEEKEEIPIEVLYDAFRTAAILSFLKKSSGKCHTHCGFLNSEDGWTFSRYS